MSEPHPEIMKYLKNIMNKIIRLNKKIENLEQNMISLGKCNSEAFKQCKICINTLAQNQEEVFDEFQTAAGTIEKCTWA